MNNYALISNRVKWLTARRQKTHFVTTRSIVFFLLFVIPGLLASSSDDGKTIADVIQKKYETNLYQLKPINQSHYAVRLYRMSGNKDYLRPILNFQFIESMQLRTLLKQVKTTPFYFNEEITLSSRSYENLSKAEKRQLLLEQAPQISTYLKILQILDHAQQLNLLNTQLYPQANETILQLKTNIEPIRNFLLNPNVMKVSPAQIVNFVYTLKRLDLIDITEDYMKTFQAVFPDIADEELNNEQYVDKIYGMTHIILAASAYYQQNVSYEEFKWIYNYFDEHIDTIINRTKIDVIAEVGICYHLAHNHFNLVLLTKIKEFLIKEFDPISQQMPSHEDKNDLDRSEHRNVLSLMFLKWPNKTRKGPDLSNSTILLDTLAPSQPL